MLSVIIPARNEKYLEKTIRNVLENSRGEIEILVVLDGWIPEPQIDIGDQRVIFYHFQESIGQRQAINYAAKQAHGDFMMKLDAHCAVDEGFDVKLAADCEYNWTVIPRMYNLDVNTWLPKLHKRTDYMYIGLRENGDIRAEYYTGQEYRKQHRKTAEIDDTMCCMGPCFFMHTKRFLELGGCDETHGGWGQQGIEVACKAWLSGGALKVNKKTWFAHWFRGDIGFPYHLSGRAVDVARKHSKELWLNNTWPLAVRDFDWLLAKFRPPSWDNFMTTQEQIQEKDNKRELTTLYRQIRRRFHVKVRDDFCPIAAHAHGNKSVVREELVKLWGEAGYKVGVEIGVWRGYFSSYILKTVPDVFLHSVDPWQVYAESSFTEEGQKNNYQRALESLQPYIDEGRCKIHKDYSMNVVDQFADGSLDFVYIDGHHNFDNCAMDLIKWCPKVRIGGMVGVHDYNAARRNAVMDVVNAYTKCHCITPWFVTRELLPTAFWVKEK